MAFASAWLGDAKKAQNLVQESETLLKSLKFQSSIDLEKREASIAYTNALISVFKGDMNQSLNYGKISLKIREKYGNKHEIAESLNNIAWAYSFLKSDLDTALKYAKRCQVLAKETNHQQIITYNLNKLGIIYSLKGEYEKALSHFEKALPLLEESNNIQWIGATVTNIATVYLQQGKYELALKYFEEGLNLARKTGNIWLIAVSLFNVFDAFRLKGDVEQAKIILEELKQINDQEENKWIETVYLVSKAFILKDSPRIRDHSKAEEILKEVIQREIIPNLDVNTDALINLCELLLEELRITNNIGVLDDLNPYIKQLVDLAKKTNSFWILAETYVLQAKLALLTLDLKGARRLLTKAQQIAEKHGMHRLAAKISMEHDNLLERLSLWKKLRASEASLSERFELTNIEEQMKNMIQKRRNDIPEIIEENPVMILVISEGGIPIFSKLFTEPLIVEDDLISSFLSAINSFSGELFSEGLDRATFGQYNLLMKSISTFLICYLFKGQSFSAQKKIQNFVENIERNEDLLEIFKKYYQTHRSLKLEDAPALNSLIIEIFINK